MANLFEHGLSTGGAQRLIKITNALREDIRASGIEEGLAVIYCPHTTAGITINENADPDVCTDILYGFEKVFPTRDARYQHSKGNSHAHMKCSVMGASQTVVIHRGEPLLGIWQAVYFCEFDGPRERKYYVKIVEG